eukprot:g63575.t1
MEESPERRVTSSSKSVGERGSFNSPARKRVLVDSNTRPQKVPTRTSPRSAPKTPKSPRKKRVTPRITRQMRARWGNTEEGSQPLATQSRTSASKRSSAHSPIANITSKPPSGRPVRLKARSSHSTSRRAISEMDTYDELNKGWQSLLLETDDTGLTSDTAETDSDRADGYDFDVSPYVLMKNLPPLPPLRTPALPRRRSADPSHCLVLDLDETLVHCSVQPIVNADITFAFHFESTAYQVYVRTRPHMFDFLRQVSQWYEIVVFTASYSEYASTLLDLLDPEHQYIKHRLFRHHCINVGGNFLKDLNILGRDLHRVALMDNSVLAFGYQVDNGIPIESWLDDPQDKELLKILPFLSTMKDLDDVRPFIRNTFRIQEYLESIPDTILPELAPQEAAKHPALRGS